MASLIESDVFQQFINDLIKCRFNQQSEIVKDLIGDEKIDISDVTEDFSIILLIVVLC